MAAQVRLATRAARERRSGGVDTGQASRSSECSDPSGGRASGDGESGSLGWMVDWSGGRTDTIARALARSRSSVQCLISRAAVQSLRASTSPPARSLAPSSSVCMDVESAGTAREALDLEKASGETVTRNIPRWRRGSGTRANTARHGVGLASLLHLTDLFSHDCRK